MEKYSLGNTGLMATRTAFGALPLQRCNEADAQAILRRAYDAGINFYDTARAYSDSEEKIGRAFDAGMRKNVIIATKTMADTYDGVMEQVRTSLANLKTDYIDILQLHNPAALPDANDQKGAYAAILELKKKGVARFIGITQHKLSLAREAVTSGLYDTLQFPFSCLSSDADIELVSLCREHGMPFIAMKALSGGLITRAAPTFAFLRQYRHVFPIWGIQRMWELEDILALDANPPALDQAMWEEIRADRESLGGSFCRGCGYCLPCPQDIPVSMAARMAHLLRRSPSERFLQDDWAEQMERIDRCTGCGACASRCPYELDTPALLKTMLADYRAYRAEFGPRA